MPNIRHGMSHHPLRPLWISMVMRCTNPNRGDYRNYGAKGIKVCEEWETIFGFVASIEKSIGPRPTPKHTLDRINSMGNYEPGNVRWATQSEQLRNQSRNHWITFDGETLCLTDWANKQGISKHTLLARIKKLGWTTHRALTESVRDWRRPIKTQVQSD